MTNRERLFVLGIKHLSVMPLIAEPQSPSQLLERIRAARLFADSVYRQLQERSLSMLDAPVAEFALHLVDCKVVTQWQAEMLLTGQVGFYVQGFRLLTPYYRRDQEALFVAEQLFPQRLMLLHLSQTGDGRRSYAAYEFVEGVPLMVWARQRQEVSEVLAGRILDQVLNATATWDTATYRRGLPEHVLLLDGGALKILPPLATKNGSPGIPCDLATERLAYLKRILDAISGPFKMEVLAVCRAWRKHSRNRSLDALDTWHASEITRHRMTFHAYLRKSPPWKQLVSELAKLPASDAPLFQQPVRALDHSLKDRSTPPTEFAPANHRRSPRGVRPIRWRVRQFMLAVLLLTGLAGDWFGRHSRSLKGDISPESEGSASGKAEVPSNRQKTA